MIVFFCNVSGTEMPLKRQDSAESLRFTKYSIFSIQEQKFLIILPDPTQNLRYGSGSDNFFVKNLVFFI